MDARRTSPSAEASFSPFPCPPRPARECPRRLRFALKKPHRSLENGEKAGASRGSSHTWGPDGSENCKFRQATNHYYEVTGDVTRSEPTALGFLRVTNTRVYFWDPTTWDCMRCETWVRQLCWPQPIAASRIRM